MASGKRILGTVAFVIGFMATILFVAVLFLKNNQITDLPEWLLKINDLAIWVGIILGVMICVILLAILIRSADERRNRRLEEEEAQRMMGLQGETDAFEASLEEPEGLGKGPEMVIYNLAALPQMYNAWTRFERKTKAWPYITPRSVESGMYTNTYIPIDHQGNNVKIRILLAGPPNAQTADLPSRNVKRGEAVMDAKRLNSIPEDIRARLPTEVRERYWPTTSPAMEADVESSVAEATTSSGGRSYLSQLDETIGRTKTNGAAGRTYYDYQGDIHNVEDIEGIGRIYGAKLAEAGVITTARLAYEDTDSLARRVGVPAKTVEQWKVMGELMKIKGVGKQYAEAMARAGMDGIAELKRRSPNAIAEQINAYLDSLDTNVLGNKVTEKRVEGWQKAAKQMRKVKLDPPAQ